MLYNIQDGKLKVIKQTGFKVEKQLQKFVEDNMKELLGITFLDTEFIIDEHHRVDSVGFDDDTNSFVLIEDKNVRDKGLVDQGFSYLAALLDRKEKFVLLYNKVYSTSKQADWFDWSQTRIIFISPEFNDHQIDSTSFQDLPFYLYRLEKYGDVVSFSRVDSKKRNLTYKDKFTTKSKDPQGILQEIDPYSEERVFPPEKPTSEIYYRLKEHLSNLGSFDIVPLKDAVSYKIGINRFVNICPMKNFLSVRINDPEGGIDDPYKLCHNIRSRAWGRLAWDIKVTSDTDMDKVFLLVKQSYEDLI